MRGRSREGAAVRFRHVLVPIDLSDRNARLLGTALTTLALPFSWVPPTSWTQVVLLLSMGLTGGLGHYLVARAYMWAPAAVVSPFNYVQLLGAAVTGYLFFGEVPAASLWLGAVLIVGSGIAMAWSEARRPAAG